MANSTPIAITVTESMAQIYITYFDIQPRNGQLPLTITWNGYLSRYDGSRERNNTRLNGENVKLQIQDPTSGAWTDTGAIATTHNDEAISSPIAYDGYFEGTATLDPAYMTQGTYQFRASYAGNSAKNFIGC